MGKGFAYMKIRVTKKKTHNDLSMGKGFAYMKIHVTKKKRV